MKDKKNLFDMNPPAHHVARVEKSVEELLINKRASERRKVWGWILAPAFASFLGVYFYRQNESQNSNRFLADQELLEEISQENDFEVVGELELLEEIELLEEWDGSEEA